MEKQIVKLELNLIETQTLIACVGQFKAADVFELLAKLKEHEQKLIGFNEK